jgi:hypothetical protein
MFGLNTNLFRSDCSRSPKGAFKPQLEALERREVMSVVTSGILAAPPTPVLANGGSVLANPGIVHHQPPPPGSASDVSFNGNAAIVVVSTPAPPARPTRTTVPTPNVKDLLFTAWNQDLPSTTNAITDFLSNPANTGGHKFYNIQLSLGAADPSFDYLGLSVNPQTNSFGLMTNPYFSNSTLNCMVDSGHGGAFDPSLQVSFNLQLVMNFTTSGPPGNLANGPVALQSAMMYFTNAVVHLNGTFVTLSDQAQAQDAFNHAQRDVTAIMNQDMATDLVFINSQLMSYAQGIPQAVVTPFYDASHAQFDLIVSSGLPSTAPAAPALAQPASPTSNPTTLVSSARRFSFKKPKHALFADTGVPVSQAMLHALAGIGNGGGDASSVADTNVSVSLDVFSAK